MSRSIQRTHQKALIIKLSYGKSMKIGELVEGIILMVLGALMLADGVAGLVMDTSFIFEGINPLFEIVVGLISIILGDLLQRESRK